MMVIYFKMSVLRVLFIVTEDWYFLSHRLSLARTCRAAGAEVSVVCGVENGRPVIEREGMDVVSCPALARRGMSPTNMLRACRHLLAILRRTPHDVVVNVSIAVVLMGTLVALMRGSPKIVNILTGLGFMFVSRSIAARISRLPVLASLFIFSRFSRVHMVVQNRTDFEMMRQLGFKPETSLHLIRGSGVDTTKFHPAEKRSEERLVTFVGRMLESKGVLDLIEAARLLQARKRRYRIVLVGAPDPKNPQSISEDVLEKAEAEGLLEYWGWQADILSVLQRSAITVLPSWREGLPKTLLEAAACGVPLIATDVPGCTEIVRHEDTGLLVPLRNPRELAEAIDVLMSSEEKMTRFGRNARFLVEKNMEQDVVNRKMCSIIF